MLVLDNLSVLASMAQKKKKIIALRIWREAGGAS